MLRQCISMGTVNTSNSESRMEPVITPRIASIKSSKLAKGRQALAHLLAFGTHYSIEEADRILQVAPFDRPVSALAPTAIAQAAPLTISPTSTPNAALETRPRPRDRSREAD